MASYTKISEMTAATALTGSESIPVVQTGANKTVAVAQLAAFITDSLLNTTQQWAARQDFAASVDIASAAIIDLTAATGNTAVITGTIPTAGFIMNAGQQMLLLPSSAWPITYHATNANINGGVSYTCAPGDRVYVAKDLAGIVRVSVIKQDGTALVASSLALLHIQDQKPSGVNGGTSIAGYNLRALNTVLTNEIAGASLASNQITLPAGTYYIEATAPAFAANRHQLRVYNVTTGSYITAVDGTSEYNQHFSPSYSVFVQTASFVSGRFTLAVSSVLELHHLIFNAYAPYGLGVDSSEAGSIDHNTYADVKIWRIA